MTFLLYIGKNKDFLRKFSKLENVQMIYAQNYQDAITICIRLKVRENHQPYVVPLEHGRSPQTVIAGIFRGADGTPAADHRHSLRSSRAKNRKFHTHRKKRRSFCFSRRREQKYKKNTAEKRNRRFFSHAPDNGKQRVLPYARIGWSDCRYHSKRAAKTIHDTPGNSGGEHPNNSVSVGKILKPYRHNPIPLLLQIR